MSVTNGINNISLNNYIGYNYITIKSELNKVSKDFVFLQKNIFEEDLKELIKYYVPYFDFNSLRNFVLDGSQLFNNNECYKAIFEAIGYKGSIKSGFIFFDKVYHSL